MFCEFIEREINCNCIVKSCCYNVNNSEFFNCVLNYLYNHLKDYDKKNFTIEDIAKITNIPIEEIERINNNSLNKIRFNVFKDRLNNKKLNRIFHFSETYICNICKISLVNKNVIEQDGFRFCSNKCLSNKYKLILENQFKTDIKDIIKEAINLFGNVEIISNVFNINRNQLEYLLSKYYPEDISLYKSKKLNLKKRISLEKFEDNMNRLLKSIFVKPKISLENEYNLIKNVLTEVI